jgi:hypothetical protein
VKHCEACDEPARHLVRYDPTGDGGGERMPLCCACTGCDDDHDDEEG